jgi:hypothetical protein
LVVLKLNLLKLVLLAGWTVTHSGLVVPQWVC